MVRGLCFGMGLFVPLLAGKSHLFPGWSGRVTPPLSDLTLTACTPPCTPSAPCAHLFAAVCCSGWRRSLRRQGAEQGNFTLTFDLHHRREGSSLYPALQGARGHQGEPAKLVRDYTETQGHCLFPLSPSSCPFPFSIHTPLPTFHRATTPSTAWGVLPRST